MKSPIVKRSVILGDHKTSVSLENEFWDSLKDIARVRETTISKLIYAIGKERQGAANLSSAIRLHVLSYYSERLRDNPEMRH
jgi:predicted DNA-binding ribbon-helix-helix protein